MDHETERDGAEIFGRQKSIHKTTIPGPRKAMSGLLLPKNFVSPNKLVGNGERDYKSRFRIERNHSGPLPNLQKNSMTNSLSEDVPEGSVVQRKGRFKITADSGPKPQVLNPSSGGMPSPPTPSIPAASLLPSLQSILQHNTAQKEEILRLIKSLDQTSGSSSSSLNAGNSGVQVETGNNGFLQVPSPRERELHSQVIQLQQSIGSLVEQLQRQKARNVELEKKLNDAVKKNGIKE